MKGQWFLGEALNISGDYTFGKIIKHHQFQCWAIIQSQKYVIEYKYSWGVKLIASWKLDIQKEVEQCLTLCRTQGILMTSQKCQHVLLFCVRCLLQYYRMQSFLEGWTSFKFSEVDGQVKQTAPAQTLCTPIAKGQNFLLSWDVFSTKRWQQSKEILYTQMFSFWNNKS